MLRPLLLAFTALGLSAGTAAAAAFDCAKASTATEYAICDNPEISTLDEQMTGLYYTLVSSGWLKPAQLNKVKTDQNKFLSRRNSCGANYQCLVDAYTDQTTALRTLTVEVTPPPAPPVPPEKPAQ
ncbi:MAG TPA: hypothetical protein PKA74_16720 [Bauldia sp.]|nr:hypothetical protein [Bauldia sp.]